jgi:hypothetical protein
MRIILLATLVIGSVACAKDLEVPSGSAADAKASEAPPATTSIAALSSNFDPEKAAPNTSPSADAGHDHSHHAHGTAPTAEAESGQYTCPHHPEVVSDKPGTCPKCKMDLVPKQAEPKQAEPKKAEPKKAEPKKAEPKKAEPAATQYTCPHHPEVVSDKPGVCPKCKMDLVPKKPEPKKTDAKPAHDHGAHP